MRLWSAILIVSLPLLGTAARGNVAEQVEQDRQTALVPILGRAALADWRAAHPDLGPEPGLAVEDVKAALVFAKDAAGTCITSGHLQAVARKIPADDSAKFRAEVYRDCMTRSGHTHWLAVRPDPDAP